MAKVGLPRIAILGGGPAGLEAALVARSQGLPFTLFEQGNPGEFVNRWGFVKMFTPLGKQTLRSDNPKVELPADTDLLTGREYRDRYLLPLAASLKDCLRTQCAVVSIGRTGWRKSDPGDGKKLPPFRILVRENNAEKFETADAILDCSGTYGRPNWVGDGGIPAMGETAARPQMAYWLEDVRGAKKANYAGKTTILIGGGYSAATTACELVELAQENSATWLIWLTHGAKSQPLPRVPNDPFKERDRLAAKANHLAARCDGNLEYHANTQIDEVSSHGPDKGFRVSGRIHGKPMLWDVDRVIANVGYKPETNLAAELRVSEPAGEFRTAEPGYFIIGAKSRGRDSGGLIRDAHEQIKQAFVGLGAISKAA
jgi:thioredoxin reductase